MSARVTVVETEELLSPDHLALFARQKTIRLLRGEEKPRRLVLSGNWQPEEITNILKATPFIATTFPDFAAANRQFRFVEEEPDPQK